MSSKVVARAYTSPSGVILVAYHWKPPANTPFFGFSIKRTPGFYDPNSNVQLPFNWLPNRLNFFGPLDEDAPSNVAPIQKFIWWDARFHPKQDTGKTFVYEITPIGGSAQKLKPLTGSTRSIQVKYPERSTNGVSTWFNRPLVSSQAFSRLMQRLGVQPNAKLTDLTPDQRGQILGWLANDLNEPISEILAGGDGIEGAIYHFTDEQWVKGAFEKRKKNKTTVTVHWKEETNGTLANKKFVRDLASNATFHKRAHVNGLMHDKILVAGNSQKAAKVLMGSANFTTGA